MDLLTTRAMDITKLALDGLMMRQQAITANTANVMTPGYQRKEVNFESQLKEIVEKDELKNYLKLQNSARNSIQYNPTSIESATGFNQQPRKLNIQEANYLQDDIYNSFAPQITDDTVVEDTQSGNNVDIEREIMDMNKVGTQYTLLSVLEQRRFKELSDVIKGQI